MFDPYMECFLLQLLYKDPLRLKQKLDFYSDHLQIMMNSVRDRGCEFSGIKLLTSDYPENSDPEILLTDFKPNSQYYAGSSGYHQHSHFYPKTYGKYDLPLLGLSRTE